ELPRHAALFGGLEEPRRGAREVLRQTDAVVIERAQRDLRVGVALVRGEQEPGDGLDVVLRHAVAVQVELRERHLRFGVAGLGALSQGIGPGRRSRPRRLVKERDSAPPLQLANRHRDWRSNRDYVDSDEGRNQKHWFLPDRPIDLTERQPPRNLEHFSRWSR